MVLDAQPPAPAGRAGARHCTHRLGHADALGEVSMAPHLLPDAGLTLAAPQDVSQCHHVSRGDPMNTTSSTFITSRHLPVPAAVVFNAIADPKLLATWWGPEGFTNHFEVCEFEPEGRWVFTMVGPDGTAYPNESVFSHIEPDRQVVIRHVCQPLFQLTITLEPSAGGTLLHWVQAFDDPAVAQAVRHIVGPANEQNLDRLAAVLA
jgi:uncharacterized protein YndB with AHSA1/START domain